MIQELPQLKELNLSGCTQITDITVEFLMIYLENSLKKIDLTYIPSIKRSTFLNLKKAGIAFSPEGALDETLDCSSFKALSDKMLGEQLALHPNIRTALPQAKIVLL